MNMEIMFGKSLIKILLQPYSLVSNIDNNIKLTIRN